MSGKKHKRKIVSAFLVVLMLLGIFFSPNAGWGDRVYAADVSVSDWDALKDAVENAQADDVITVTADITMPADYPGFTIDENLTIKAADSSTPSITRELPTDRTLKALGPMFKLESGTLTLGEGLILDGNYSAAGNTWFKGDFASGTRGFFVQTAAGSTLVIDGATFQYYKTEASDNDTSADIPAGVSPIFIGGNFTMNKGAIKDNWAGAVKNVEPSGTISLNNFYANPSFLTWAPEDGGGKARINGEPNVSRSASDWTVSQTTAGAIFIDAPTADKIEINGGTITGNAGNVGGLAVAGGSLTIKGGEISNGWGDHFGGGIYTVTEDAEVRMCGGTVKANESPMGGGVFSTTKSTFFLMGGTIEENKSYGSGGGLLVYSDNVYLLSGTIKGNSAPNMGGGVYVYGNDENIYGEEGQPSYQYVMTLHNAEIVNNEAVGTVTDPRIKGVDRAFDSNTAADRYLSGSGGGIWLCPAGVSEFDGSTFNIYNNKAVMQGDDFHKDGGFSGGVLIDFGPHEKLDEWEHQELEGSRRPYVDSEKKKNHQKLTLAEATSGSNGSISLVHLNTEPNAPNPQLFITENVSLRGGGIGSNGVVIFSDSDKPRNIEKGELEFEKTFTELPEQPMEFDMILADADGNPIDKDGNITNDAADEVRIMTFRLFDSQYATQYNTKRVTPGTREFGQLAAKWNTDYSKITIDFPEGRDDISFFDGEQMTQGEKLNVIFREYEVKSDNTRGAKVSERIFTYETPEFEAAETMIEKEIKIYRGGTCTDCTNQQGCDNCSCDPGEADTFSLKYRKYNFDTTAENREIAEIEKYVEQAVHKDIKLDDVFSYDILAYIPRDADEVTITDSLVSDLEFAQTDGNVTVYDLGETTDDAGNTIPVDSNHLPVYDASGAAIDNGSVTPSVKEGERLGADEYKLTVDKTPGANKLTVVFKNTLDDAGNPVLGEPQNATPRRGHYVRIHFDAQIAKSIRDEIDAGTKTIADLESVTILDSKEDTTRPVPNVGNDPVVSDEDHTGIPNTASYEIKVKNEAEAKDRYKDTSNTVTVKVESPDEFDIPVNKVWDEFAGDTSKRPTSITINLLENGVFKGKTITLTEDASWKGVFRDLPKTDLNGNEIAYTIEEVAVDYYYTDILWADLTYKVTNHMRPWIPELPSTPGNIGHVKVTKTVTGAAEKDKDYEIEVTFTYSDGSTYVHELTLNPKSNPEFLFDYIPVGTEVEVSEKTTGYNATFNTDGKKGSDVVVEIGKVHEIVINNDKPGKSITTGDENRIVELFVLIALLGLSFLTVCARIRITADNRK